MRIYFSRHGESQANLLHEVSNIGLKHPLTAQGRRQAEELALALDDRHITRIFSSPVLRAVETSIILAHRLYLPYQVTEALREYDCGILEGRSDDACWATWQELFDDWAVRLRYERRIEGGESFYEVQRRFVPFIEGLIRQYGDDPEEQVLCIGHGGLYWMMLPLVVNNVGPDFVRKHGFPFVSPIVCDVTPLGITCTEWAGTKL